VIPRPTSAATLITNDQHHGAQQPSALLITAKDQEALQETLSRLSD
jgi:hypothetical protein